MTRFAIASILLLAASATAQPPAPPPINPAQAKLDQTIGSLDGPGLALAAHEQAGFLAAGCERGTIQYWGKGVALGVRVGDRTPNLLKAHQGPITALAWGAGCILASTGTDRKLILWEMPEGKALHTLTVPAPLRALAMAPDGKLLAGAGEDAAIQLWEVATGKPTVKLAGHSDWVQCLTFSGDGKLLASGGYDGVRLWETASGKKLLDIAAKPPDPPKGPETPPNTVLALAFSPDGKQLVLGGTDAQIHFVNVADGKFVRALPGHNSSVTALLFHPSGGVLVSASRDRTVRLWNPANGQALKVLEGHTAWVQGVVFLAQGTRLASVGADQTVRLWDMAEVKK